MQQRDGHAQCCKYKSRGECSKIQWKFDADSTCAKTFVSQVMCDVRLVVHDYGE
jgi:hypothetical protein